MKLISYAILISFFVLGSANAGEKIETEELSLEELKSILVDHTYPIGGKSLKNAKGAMYFMNDETFEIVWEGRKGTGSWQVDGDSKFCYTNTLWSGRECITLLRNITEGGFIHVFEGQKRVLKDGAIEKGRKIK